MPIIIDAVVISVEVTNDVSGGISKPATKTEEKQAIIEECVERVLSILEQKAER